MISFADEERALLLGVKGVGPTVIQRLEEVGIHDLPALAAWEPAALCAEISQRLGATCWRNSPLANRAIAEAVALARRVSLARPTT